MAWMSEIGHALWMALTMLWQIFWGLSLGFLVSAIVEATVSKSEMSSLLPDPRPRSLAKASLLGAASSSCSYAAVAMARSIVRKGGNFTAAMVFQIAATNLVLELGVLLWVLIAWQFTVAAFAGGAIMIVLLAVGYWTFLTPSMVQQAKAQADRGIAGSMEGHAAMSMGGAEGRWIDRLMAKESWVAIAHHYVMNWTMLWRDIGAGLLIAGALAAWVPETFWQAFFLTGHPAAAAIWGAFVGPLLAVVSFTCSVGNVPLAAVLWRGGISFGGVAAFMFGDLIILPILNIYRKYYGGRMTAFIAVSFYLAMVAAALLVEWLFGVFGWTPTNRHTSLVDTSFSLNYTTVLDIIFGIVLLGLAAVFLRTGGPAMLKMMNDDSPHDMGDSHHHHHDHHHHHSR